jgi:hypothetical protein
MALLGKKWNILGVREKEILLVTWLRKAFDLVCGITHVKSFETN